MDSTVIEKILNSNTRTSKIFRGCFPSDLLPQPSTLNYPAALIVNMDSHRFDGSHWMAIYAYGLNKEVYYFDSLALPIIPPIQIFLNFFPKIIKNSQVFQNPLTNTCAHYCICFVHFLSIGYTFAEFTHLLSRSYNSDYFVRYIVNKLTE